MKHRLIILMAALLSVSCAEFASQRANQGVEAFEEQRYKDAAKMLEKAEKMGYDEPELHFYLGSTYLVMGEYERAVEELKPVAGHAPLAWYRLGNAYYNLDRREEAAQAYRNAIALDKHYLEAIEALAMLYPDGGVTREEALDLWKQALELETRDEWITRAKHYIDRLEREE